MQSDPSRSGRARRRLSASEKYELYLSVITGQATQREAAERWKVDRSTVVHVCRTAKTSHVRWLSSSGFLILWLGVPGGGFAVGGSVA